jgi:hypothetical protein
VISVSSSPQHSGCSMSLSSSSIRHGELCIAMSQLTPPLPGHYSNCAKPSLLIMIIVFSSMIGMAFSHPGLTVDFAYGDSYPEIPTEKPESQQSLRTRDRHTSPRMPCLLDPANRVPPAKHHDKLGDALQQRPASFQYRTRHTGPTIRTPCRAANTSTSHPEPA